MTTQGIILVLLSACCHAGWNLLSKTRGDPVSFLRQALFYSAVCYLPLFAVLQFTVGYSLPYLYCVVGSGVLTGLYFFALGKAYQHGHMSVAYPIARTFPIFVVTWAGLLFGERPSPQGLVGICIIVVGCFVLPLRRFAWGEEGASWRSYANWSCLWALLAALFTSGYSVIDKYAALEITRLAGGEGMAGKVNYVYLQNVTAWLTVVGVKRLLGMPVVPALKRRTIPAGLIFLVSYSLIVMAFATDPAAYVVSLRQLSIVITALVSMFIIEREFSWPRLVGVLVIFTGVLLVGLS